MTPDLLAEIRTHGDVPAHVASRDYQQRERRFGRVAAS